MSDSIVKAEPAALAITPKEALAFAENNFVNAMQHMSGTIQHALNAEEIALFHEWFLKKVDDLEAFRELMRKRLLEQVIAGGTKVTDKGTLELDLGNGRVQRASPVTTLPDDKLTERMLRECGKDPNTHMVVNIKLKASEEKLKNMVEHGHLTEEQLKKCYKPTSYKLGKTGVKGDNDE